MSSPVFGITSIGGYTSNVSINYFFGIKYTSPADANDVIKISVYCKDYNGVSNNAKAIIADSNGILLANGISSPSVVGGSYAWIDFTFPVNPTISPSTEYIFGIVAQASWITIATDVLANLTIRDISNNYNNPTNPGAISYGFGRLSIYCTYTPPFVPSPNLTNRKNHNGYLAFVQQYIKHRLNNTTPWSHPNGYLIS